jgi:hypothetical protein
MGARSLRPKGCALVVRNLIGHVQPGLKNNHQGGAARVVAWTKDLGALGLFVAVHLESRSSHGGRARRGRPKS